MAEEATSTETATSSTETAKGPSTAATVSWTLCFAAIIVGIAWFLIWSSRPAHVTIRMDKAVTVEGNGWQLTSKEPPPRILRGTLCLYCDRPAAADFDYHKLVDDYNQKAPVSVNIDSGDVMIVGHLVRCELNDAYGSICLDVKLDLPK